MNSIMNNVMVLNEAKVVSQLRTHVLRIESRLKKKLPVLPKTAEL